MKILRIKNQLFWIIFFLVISLSWGVAPTPSPFYQYDVIGKITRNSNQLKNFSITIYAKDSINSDVAIYKYPYTDFVETPDNPISITDWNGKFHVRISTNKLYDSIAIGVIAFDSYPVIGKYFAVNSVKANEVKTNFTFSNESGCSCENTTSSELVTTGYIYSYEEIILNIPY